MKLTINLEFILYSWISHCTPFWKCVKEKKFLGII